MNIEEQLGHGFESLIKQDSLQSNSLINFQELFEDIFSAITPKSICEIGIESELFSQFILKYCIDNCLHYSGVDSDINAFTLHKESSFGEINVMDSLSYFESSNCQYSDIYIINREHSYYSFYNELKSIYYLSQRSKKNFPLIFLHNSFCSCKKQEYYSSIPATNKGISKLCPQIVSREFQEEGNFSIAQQEENENIINTVIDDFQKEVTDLSLKKVFIPAMLGVTVIFSPLAYNNDVLEKIKKSFSPWEKIASFLKRIEYNRLELYRNILELQDKVYIDEKQVGVPQKEIHSLDSGSMEEKISHAVFNQQKEILDLINWQSKTLSDLVLRSTQAQSQHHNTFAEYKNRFQGRDIVILGCGPTLNNYIPIKDAIHIGCNRAFLFDKVQLDICFVIDWGGIINYRNDFLAYKGNNCVKFIGEQIYPNGQIPQSYTLQLNDVKGYKTTADIPIDFIPLDLDCQPLFNSVSVAHQAMQFAFYTNPSRIYLVGMDCTGPVYFEGETSLLSNEGLELARALIPVGIDGWKRLKDFGETHYPKTEVLSVNPVKLAGLFKDIYTNKKD